MNMKLSMNLLAVLMTVSISSAAIAGTEVKESYDRNDYSVFSDEVQGLLASNSCKTCHAVTKPDIGPAFRDIADRYRGKTKYKYHGFTPKHIWTAEMPVVAGLVKKVSQGGNGDWADTPMPQMDGKGYKKDVMTKLVKAILEIPALPEEEEVGAESEDELSKAKEEIKALRAQLQNTAPQQPKTHVWTGQN